MSTSLTRADIERIRDSVTDPIGADGHVIRDLATTCLALMDEPLLIALQQNKCGDAECEEVRLDAALRCLRGGPTHRATADMVNASEDAWRDACSTESVRADTAEARIHALEEGLRAMVCAHDDLFDGDDGFYCAEPDCACQEPSFKNARAILGEPQEEKP